MRGRLVTMACGLVLTVALGVPAAAQAAVTGPANARTTAAAPDAALSCATIFDVGNHHYAGWNSSSKQKIYFGVDLSHAIPFCNVNRGGGNFWIEEEVNGHLSGECLWSDPVVGATEFPCSDYGTDWTATKVGSYHGQSVWEFADDITLLCLYDYKQNPAIEATCHSFDGFEQFVWDALP